LRLLIDIEVFMEIASGKKLYSLKESYWIFYKGLVTMKYMARAKKRNELSAEFIERIMMAVTEVNGCDICSYAHAKMALEIGISNKEINNMLAGIIDDVPPDEIAGVMFAQHYADSRGQPSKEAWDRVVENFGIFKAKGILGAIRIIMLGNTYGIPFSSFFKRFKAKPDKRSSILYEISMMISCVVFFPIVLIHALISCLFRMPVINLCL
jgi:AhpD family alkylhydroperoxidase